MTARAAWLALGGAVAALVASALAADLPALSGGRFWGDGATYYAMAWSLAEDGDLRYEARDLLRVRREFPSGPDGVFLKRASGGLAVDGSGFPWLRRVPREEPRIYFAKPFAYSLVAAPLVRLLGTRGLLLVNALSLALTLVLAYLELARRASPGRALAAAGVLTLATAAPAYLLWPTPELFNMALVAAGLVAWRRDRPCLSAVLLGVATYSKPYNLWLALPLGIAPFLPPGGRSFRFRLLTSVARGLALAGTIVALFGLNAAITGEANYQGGHERKTFYGKFPFDVEVVGGRPREVTFGNSGIWMSTDTLGPQVEGEQPAAPSHGAEPARSGAELRASFVRNLLYFWVGRFGGAAPYFFPAVLALLAFLVLGPRDTPGWLATASLAVSFLFYIVMIPDNWYGGTGTVGNRYFLNLLPLAILLVPPGREWLVSVGGLAGSAVFLWPILLAPMYHSLHSGAQATRGPLRLLPAELTMLNDLAIFSEPWRKKQPVGDTEGDRWRHWPADPEAYYLYFPDDGTWGREEGPGGPGFWLRGGQAAEVILRALEPVRRMELRLTGGPAGDGVYVRVGWHGTELSLRPEESRQAVFQPGAGFMYKDTFVYVLRFRSARGGQPAGADTRALGAFVHIDLEVDKRPRG